MSDVLITYKNSNKFEKYFVVPAKERQTIDTLTTNFIQELVTEKGTCAFDKKYGSYFIRDIGEHVNIHKIRYVLDESIEDIKKKYGIVNVSVDNAQFNASDGFMEIWLSIEYEEIAVEKRFNFMYDGLYTDKIILEMD